MKCPKCGCYDELQAMVDIEEWEDTEPDNKPEADLSCSATVWCGSCRHQAVAREFGLKATLHLVPE